MQPPRVGLSLPGPLPPPPSRAANSTRGRAPSRAAVRGACFAAAAASAAAALTVAHPATATVAAPTSPPGPRKPTFEFWAGLWSKNDLGFHKPTVHETLLHYRKEFLGDAPARVLVPLCGKTHDLAWLATHSGAKEVVGVEFVQQALEEFAKEHAELKLKKAKPQGAYKFVLAAGALKLLCGDIFALPGDGGFDRVWDRASLVALDPVQRQRYAACITAAMAPRGVMLLQVLHRQAGAPLALQGGPPFSVSEADVKALYGSAFDIKKLESTDAMPSNPRFKASGLTKISQVTYLLTKKA